jgi:hypothetical protein
MVIVDNENILEEFGEVDRPDMSDLCDVNELSLLRVVNSNIVSIDRLDLVACLSLGNEGSSRSIRATLSTQVNHVSLYRTCHISQAQSGTKLSGVKLDATLWRVGGREAGRWTIGS